MVGMGERGPDADARSCVRTCRGSREPTSVQFVVVVVVGVVVVVVSGGGGDVAAAVVGDVVVAAVVVAAVACPLCVQVPARDARRRVCAGSLPCGRCCHRESS